MASSAMGLNLGIFGFFADHTRENQCVHDLRMPSSVLRMLYLHAPTAVDAVTYAPEELRLF